MSAASSAAAASKLAAARARLIVEKPFIGALLLHLPLQEAKGCRSIATDARRIYYAPAYVDGLSSRQAQFVLAHQALHCALGHFARRGHRLRARWDRACDYAVDQLLVEEGLEPVAGAALDPSLRALAAEEIYPLLADDSADSGFDVHLFDACAGAEWARPADEFMPLESAAAGRPIGQASNRVGGERGGEIDSDAAPQPHSHEDGMVGPEPRRDDRFGSMSDRDESEFGAIEELAQRWQMRLAMAHYQARHAGRLGAAWQRLFTCAVEPSLPWRTLLARHLTACAQEDYSFQRPRRRESDALLPRLRSDAIDVHAVLDTSGSIDAARLGAFLEEVDALKGQVRARVTLHACDHELGSGGPWSFEPWQAMVLPTSLPGGGDTDFRPIFEWLRARALRPDLLIYFTDAHGDFPAAPPPYPVLWLVQGSGAVPWGERIQLN